MSSTIKTILKNPRKIIVTHYSDHPSSLLNEPCYEHFIPVYGGLSDLIPKLKKIEPKYLEIVKTIETQKEKRREPRFVKRSKVSRHSGFVKDDAITIKVKIDTNGLERE